MRLQHVRSLDELDSLKDTWVSLENIKGGPSIFQSWEWNRTWVECVLPSRKNASLDVGVVEDGAGRIIAILPFFEERLLGPVAKLVQFLGHRMSFHNDILLAEPENFELTTRVVQLLSRSLGMSTILCLRHLASESVFTKTLITQGLAQSQCSRILIKADSNITDQAMRLGKSRKSFRCRGNKLRREYSCEFRVCSGDEFPEAFDGFVDLHQKRFSSKNRSTLLEGVNLMFLKKAMSRFRDTKNFEVVQLKANGVTIATAVLALSHRRYFNINIGFDPNFSSYAPMKLLLAETMRRAFDDLDCELYDLGPGYEPYKYDWKPSIGTNYFCSIGGAGLYAKSLASLYGAAFRRKVQAQH